MTQQTAPLRILGPANRLSQIWHQRQEQSAQEQTRNVRRHVAGCLILENVMRWKSEVVSLAKEVTLPISNKSMEQGGDLQELIVSLLQLALQWMLSAPVCIAVQ